MINFIITNMMKNYETKIIYKLNENEETIAQDFYA